MNPEPVRTVVVLGAGGTGRSIMGSIPRTREAFFLDDAVAPGVVNGRRMAGGLDRLPEFPPSDHAVIVGFGCNYMAARRARYEELSARYAMERIVHPSCAIDDTAGLGEGTWLGPLVSVMVNARVGANVIICTSCSIDHDSVIGDHAYLSPGVSIAGGVVVEEGAFLGTNATLLPGARVGRGAVVGAGAVVRGTVEAGTTVVGVPARRIAPR